MEKTSLTISTYQMKIASNQAKRILADHLRETDPDMLEFVMAVGEVFGKVEWIELEDEVLLEKLQEKIKN